MSKNISPPHAVTTRALSKTYPGDVLAVDQLDLTIPSNTIYALLGPNGAGKTTTLSMLSTLARPSAGTAEIMGLDVVRQADAVRRKIGVTFQEIVLDPDLTGRQSLDFHARLYGIPKTERVVQIDQLLALVELDEAANRRARTYSGGMKRRLELARGLITSPDVLFLDEPTQGLDPQNRTNLWEYIRSLQQTTRITILLTTHYMEEAEALADWVGIMDHGRIVVEGTPQQLIAQMGADRVQMSGRGSAQHFAENLRQQPFISGVHLADDLVSVGVDDGNRRLVRIVEIANRSEFIIEDISVSKPGLSDVFLKHTGRQLRDK